MKWLVVLIVVALTGCQSSAGGGSGPRVKCNTYLDGYGDAQTSCY